jgi:hypothetical protein
MVNASCTRTGLMLWDPSPDSLRSRSSEVHASIASMIFVVGAPWYPRCMPSCRSCGINMRGWPTYNSPSDVLQQLCSVVALASALWQGTVGKGYVFRDSASKRWNRCYMQGLRPKHTTTHYTSPFSKCTPRLTYAQVRRRATRMRQQKLSI